MLKAPEGRKGMWSFCIFYGFVNFNLIKELKSFWDTFWYIRHKKIFALKVSLSPLALLRNFRDMFCPHSNTFKKLLLRFLVFTSRSIPMFPCWLSVHLFRSLKSTLQEKWNKNSKSEADSGIFLKNKTSTTWKKSTFLGYSRWVNDLNIQAWSGVSPCFKNSAELTDCGVDMWRRTYIRSLF